MHSSLAHDKTSSCSFSKRCQKPNFQMEYVLCTFWSAISTGFWNFDVYAPCVVPFVKFLYVNIKDTTCSAQKQTVKVSFPHVTFFLNCTREVHMYQARNNEWHKPFLTPNANHLVAWSCSEATWTGRDVHMMTGISSTRARKLQPSTPAWDRKRW